MQAHSRLKEYLFFAKTISRYHMCPQGCLYRISNLQYSFHNLPILRLAQLGLLVLVALDLLVSLLALLVLVLFLLGLVVQ